MVKDFVIPNLGEGIEAATIVRWLVADGAQVRTGDDILELETDKATIPVPANADGYLRIGPFEAQAVVSVGAVVATIGPKGESFAPGSGEAAAETTVEPPPADGALKVTPVARKMAVELGVELADVAGSGEHGKITKADVRQAAAGTEAGVPAPTAPAEPAPEPQTVSPTPAATTPPAAGEVLRTVPVKGIRGVIVRRMAESVHTTARVTLVTEVDATELVALREQFKARYAGAWGFAPGYNDLLALIVASALREFPYMNARLSEDGQVIEQLKPVNLGLAVDTERGLLVTVIRDADQKGLRQFGAEFRELVERARTGKNTPEELSGGTFTITNLGMYRVDAFTPVINLPEAAILGVGRIAPRPVARGEAVVVRKMMTLSLVFDHRLVDGAPAARFLDYICEVIEDPALLFLTKR